MMDDAANDFYEVSRCNVAVLLTFWLAYILAYGLCTRLITPHALVKAGTAYSRRRRSNLSLLMLLTPPDRRTHSLPPIRSTSRTSSSRTGSIGEISESESRG